MRIAHVTMEFPPCTIGGAGEYAYQLVRQLDKMGHELTVIYPSIDGAKAEPLGNVQFAPVTTSGRPGFSFPTFSAGAPRALAREHRRKPFDVVHGNGIAHFSSRWVARGVPRVATVHHLIADLHTKQRASWSLKTLVTEENRLLHRLERSCIEHARAVITVNGPARQAVIEHYGSPPDRVHAILNGIHVDEFDVTREWARDTLAKAGFDLSRPIVYTAPGTVTTKRKAIDVLLAALEAIAAEVPFTLVVSGKGDPTELLAPLGPEMRARAVFPGFVSTDVKRALYAHASVFCIPSILEGCPISLLEALAAGTPIVASNVGGIPEVAIDGENGLLARPGDASDLREKLRTVLTDASLRERMRARNRERALKHFSWDVVGEQHIAAFRSAL